MEARYLHRCGMGDKLMIKIIRIIIIISYIVYIIYFIGTVLKEGKKDGTK